MRRKPIQLKEDCDIVFPNESFLTLFVSHGLAALLLAFEIAKIFHCIVKGQAIIQPVKISNT